MMRYWISTGFLLALLATLPYQASAQELTDSQGRIYVPEDYMFDMIDGKVAIRVFELPDVYVFPELTFRNEKERQEYLKLVHDVKRALPYAKMIYNTLIETYEYIETMSDMKAKDAHLKRMEKELYNQFKPEMRKLTLAQGKLLIKLVDRECNQTSFNLVSVYLGKIRASFWNVFAGMFGASLKTKYDPKGKDMMTEYVVVLVERGLI